MSNESEEYRIPHSTSEPTIPIDCFCRGCKKAQVRNIVVAHVGEVKCLNCGGTHVVINPNSWLAEAIVELVEEAIERHEQESRPGW